MNLLLSVIALGAILSSSSSILKNHDCESHALLPVRGGDAAPSQLSPQQANDTSSVSNDQSKPKVVVIVGAGPAGLLLAHALIRRSAAYEVHIIEQRSDPRQTTTPLAALATYPISLQQKRGIEAIREVGGSSLVEAILNKAAVGWMNGALVRQGDLKVSQKSFASPMLSLDRNRFVEVLLEHLEKTVPSPKSSLHLHFETSLQDVLLEGKEKQVLVRCHHSGHGAKQRSWRKKKFDARRDSSWRWQFLSHLPFSQWKILSFDSLVAADGARSVVRQRLTQNGFINSTTTQLPFETKALRIPLITTRSKVVGPIANQPLPKGTDMNTTIPETVHSVNLTRGVLNMWSMPQGSQALAAVPCGQREQDRGTPDECPPYLCTGVLTFPLNMDPFSNMTSPEQVLKWFQQGAPLSLTPYISREEAESLLQRPILGTYSVKTSQLHAKGNVLLVGDAAHSTSGLLGQGANSALQDIAVFVNLLDQKRDCWGASLEAFTCERLPQLQAMQQMSEFTIPPTPAMLREFRQRQAIRNFLPMWMRDFIVGHDVMQLLADTDLSYTEVLRKTEWWSNRVKEATLEEKKKAGTSSS